MTKTLPPSLTGEVLLDVASELVGEDGGEEHADHSPVQSTQHSKHLQQQQPDGDTRLLREGMTRVVL